MKKLNVFIAQAGRNNTRYGGYCSPEFGSILFEGIWSGIQRLTQDIKEHPRLKITTNENEADVIVVIVLACLCCSSIDMNTINRYKKTGKKVISIMPLPGAVGKKDVDYQPNVSPEREYRMYGISKRDIIKRDDERWNDLTCSEFGELIKIRTLSLIEKHLQTLE